MEESSDWNVAPFLKKPINKPVLDSEQGLVGDRRAKRVSVSQDLKLCHTNSQRVSFSLSFGLGRASSSNEAKDRPIPTDGPVRAWDWLWKGNRV